MSRLSFRPRPLDIHKKLPIFKSVKEFEEDEPATTSTRNSQFQRFATDADAEVPQTPSRKNSSEIPTPQFVVVDTYERDYSSTFVQTPSYLRGRGARAEIGEYNEYDLDDEDEDWLEEFIKDKKILPPEKFEVILFKLEVLDHKTRERAGIITPTLGLSVPVLLQLDAAYEALQYLSIRYSIFQSVYKYWKAKRERWQKPILRRLQEGGIVFTFPLPLFPGFCFGGRQMSCSDGGHGGGDGSGGGGGSGSGGGSGHRLWFSRKGKTSWRDLYKPPPPVNDTNPYNVFRPREKAHRLHTRRMQRRENNVQSFEKLRQVRRNLEQAKTVLEALIKREEKKREVMESEVSLQRNQIKYKHETQLFDDGLALSGFPTFPLRFGSSEDDIVDSDEMTIGPQRTRPAMAHNLPPNSRPSMVQARGMKRNFRQRPPPHGFFKRDPLEPVLLFSRPLDPVKLAAAGIVPPSDPPVEDGGTVPPYRFHGRIGRGGRIVFDRWNPLLRTPIGLDSSPYFSPNPRPLSNGG
ncbi:hypothetical protein QJS10_CPA08g01932 [Acorus calamus]|uniref:Enhancer of polycomb-like protein n=1 Tax=Acorus calamus TaxID=4465 RepID=A0AAV9E9R9_ACOCL|nr:hypothetical protein QJS10_CPA08g01932 [Acorus calamus]